MAIGHVILRWIIQPFCTLVIGRACLEVAHAFEWYPEQQLARLIMGAPSALENELVLWGLAAIIGMTLWAFADYFLYRKKTAKIQPRKPGRRTAVAPPPALLSSVWDDFERERAEKAKVKVDGLEKLIENGRALSQRPVHSDEEYVGWKKDYKSWLNSAEEFIRSHIGHHAAGIFRRGHMIVGQPIERAFNNDHNMYLNVLSYRLLDLTQDLEVAKDDQQIHGMRQIPES